MKINTKRILKQYKFCFKCSGQLQYKKGNSFVCKGCGFQFYLNPTFSTSVVLENEKGEILLVERKVDPKKGSLDTPGGFIDLEESAEEGMNREINEELGISVKDLKYFNSYPDEYLWDGVNLALVSLVFTGKINSSQNIKVTDDVSGYEFFKPNEIPLERVGFESIKKALEDFLKSRK